MRIGGLGGNGSKGVAKSRAKKNACVDQSSTRKGKPKIAGKKYPEVSDSKGIKAKFLYKLELCQD